MSYIDTSVLVAYYCPEPLSPVAQKALLRIKAPAISPLVEVEFYSAMAMKVRAGGIALAAAQQVFAQFQVHLVESKFQMVAIQAAEYRLAREWMTQLST